MFNLEEIVKFLNVLKHVNMIVFYIGNETDIITDIYLK